MINHFLLCVRFLLTRVRSVTATRHEVVRPLSRRDGGYSVERPLLIYLLGQVRFRHHLLFADRTGLGLSPRLR